MAKNEKDKQTNNNTQETPKNTKDWATRTPTKPGVISGALEG